MIDCRDRMSASSMKMYLVVLFRVYDGAAVQAEPAPFLLSFTTVWGRIFVRRAPRPQSRTPGYAGKCLRWERFTRVMFPTGPDLSIRCSHRPGGKPHSCRHVQRGGIQLRPTGTNPAP